MKKIAILFVGNIRTWNNCKESFHSIFDKYEPDIFISTNNKLYDYHPVIQGRIRDSNDINIDIEKAKSYISDLNFKEPFEYLNSKLFSVTSKLSDSLINV